MRVAVRYVYPVGQKNRILIAPHWSKCAAKEVLIALANIKKLNHFKSSQVIWPKSGGRRPRTFSFCDSRSRRTNKGG
eukprot:COSAG02_NODE_2411_length_8920_cov_5.544496_5_plen_77_part_00